MKKELEEVESTVNRISVLATTLERVNNDSILGDCYKVIISDLIGKEINKESSAAWLKLYEVRHDITKEDKS